MPPEQIADAADHAAGLEPEPVPVERDRAVEVVDGERDDVYARFHPAPQLTAFFTSARMRFSSAAVSSFSA